jgi:DNA polymerase-1
VAALRARITAQGLLKIFTDIEQPLIKVLAKMKQLGIALDTKYLATLSIQFHTELELLEKNIYEQAGVIFNINSPKQLGEVLFDTLGLKPKNAKKTAGGQRSTKESELEKLRDAHPIISELLRYRELQKLVSTYVDNLPLMVGADGRIHSTLLQTGAATGRMASKDPNLQNIPIRTVEGRLVRGAFIAAQGYQLVAIDYSQIELRIAAILSEDKNMMDIFRRGEDVHAGVAARVFGVAANEVTPDMRRKAKVINFGILYGMGVNALRQNLGAETTRQEAQEFLNAYFQTFTRLAEYLEDTKTFARQNGYTETLLGRRRYFPGITSNIQFIRAQAERMAINAPIQGTAADCMRIAMLRVHEYIEATENPDAIRMLLQVHDELVFEIESSRVSVVVPVLVRLMEQVLTEEESHEVPLIASAKVGKNWNELTEVKH